LIAVDQPADAVETLKTQLKEYPEVQETFAVCKKATKSEYMEDYIPKKTVKKAVKKTVKK
jgi:predicted translin family RNA/ssDNA-binding protein